MIFLGNLVFWVLVSLAVGAVLTYLGRFFDLRRAQIDGQDFLKGVFNVLDAGNDAEALAICDDTPSPISAVVATAVRNRHGVARVLRDAVDAQGRAEINRLRRRLAVLSIIGQISPLLGLFGTILDFIRTIRLVDAVEPVLRTDLVNGCLAALVTAALGLAVAIAVAVMYGDLRLRLDRIAVEMEAAASAIIGYISAQREKGKAA